MRSLHTVPDFYRYCRYNAILSFLKEAGMYKHFPCHQLGALKDPVLLGFDRKGWAHYSTKREVSSRTWEFLWGNL